MSFELTDEELKKTREFYDQIRNEKIYDEKGNIINGKQREKNADVQPIQKCSDEDLGER